MAERERGNDGEAEASNESALAAAERGRWWPENTPEGRGLRTASGAMTATAFATVAALMECLHRADLRKSKADRPKRTMTTDEPHDG